MMREYLFRGKRIDNGEWVEGDFYHRIVHIDTFHQNIVVPAIEVFDGKNPLSIAYYTVDPATVGQFTGMTDKNGKKIFEGDIVRANDGTIYPVVWGGTGFYLKYNPPHAHGLHYDLLPLCNYWHAHGAIIEVIGNIHDQPELLETT